jgi:hypothetical protein
MSLPGFYNDDAARSYPLVPFSNAPWDGPGDPVEIQPPMDTLVDFGCLVGLDAEFDAAQHSVYLHQITRAGSVFTFDFRSDAPGLVGYALVFSRHLTDVEYATDYSKAVPLPGTVEPQEPLWEGFLVTGPLESLAAMMPTDGNMTASTGPQVEPSLIQNLGRSYVRTINLANQDRTRVSPPDGCDGTGTAPSDGPVYIVNATGLAGDLRFKEGFNVSIRQNVRSNSLAFSALQGAGAGDVCYEVPLYAGEQPPAGSTLLTGGPACDEVINSINGLSASVIRLVPALGTRIVPADDQKSLIVDFDRHDMTVCGPIQVVVEELPDA